MSRLNKKKIIEKHMKEIEELKETISSNTKYIKTNWQMLLGSREESELISNKASDIAYARKRLERKERILVRTKRLLGVGCLT